MPAMDNVIKGLKYLHDVKRWSPDESEESITARRNITGDALTLLKAQEPIAPVSTTDDDWICGNCANGMVGYSKIEADGIEIYRLSYCPNCGRKVKW